MYLDTFEIENESIIIGNGGSICVHFDKKFTASKHVTVCQINDTKYSIKYIYYYLILNVQKLKDLSAGSTIMWLNKSNMGSLKIPIPSIKVQEEIINYCDAIHETIKLIETQIKNNEILMKNILSKFLQSDNTLVKSKNIKKEIESSDDSENSSESDTESENEKPKKKLSKKKVIVSSDESPSSESETKSKDKKPKKKSSKKIVKKKDVDSSDSSSDESVKKSKKKSK